jgi:hypothetical protein
MDKFIEAIVTIASLIAGVAIVATLVSKKANTPAVIQAAASGYANNIGVAISPVTGNSYNIDLSYPSSGGIGSMGLPSLN